MDIREKIKQQLNHLRNYEDLDYPGLRTLKIIEDLVDQLNDKIVEKELQEQKPQETAEEKELRDIVLDEYKKGNIVVSTFEGLQMMSLDEFIKQPVEGILYDLNRGEAVVLTFINDPKWINDFAVSKVIQKLYSEFTKLQKGKEIADEEIEKAAYDYAVHHSSAPDKETPDWIMADFKAGIEWLKKELNIE